MRIYAMTATFGKLENQTLTLQPGLNVIHAPNEWGKSTWCAFLVNMLYGLETRVKSTKATLADKERYAPWSGSPMSGRIDLNWQGQDITIERWTKGRTPMGEFRAYETHSGLPVPELTAQNCGETLLGVERSVFMRSAFVRLADLPVTEDESLRRRLNALVTTGDESATGDILAQKLRDLKNKCRYNRSGALPTAEREAAQLEQTLRQMDLVQQQLDANAQRQAELKTWISQLENHQLALQYAAGQENERLIAQAQLRLEAAKERLTALESQCADLPAQAHCAQAENALRQLHQQTIALDMERQMLPPPPEKPATGDFSQEQANRDGIRFREMKEKCKQWRQLATCGMIGCGVAAVAAVISLVLKLWPLSIVGLLLGAIGAVTWVLVRKKSADAQGEMDRMADRYGADDPAQWLIAARQWEAQQSQYQCQLAEYEQTIATLRQRQEALNSQIQALTQGNPISQCLAQWEQASRRWAERNDALQTYENAKTHAQMLSAMAKPLVKPSAPDTLTETAEQTQRLLAEARAEQQHLQQSYGNYLGRMETMGRREDLQAQLDALHDRIAQLNRMYAALELAQATLAAATGELQRLFAPKIAQESQALFADLTQGRYDRLTLTQDLSLQTGAQEESVLHTVQWRSEGTADQMYLALRLAVSRALIPDAPLVLDDALVRFDDQRLASAMEILRRQAQQRQIILFTCQSRETQFQ